MELKRIIMLEMYKKVVFENYANFKGRARRSEYWYFILANFCILFALVIIGALVGGVFGIENGKADAAVRGGFIGYVIYFFYTFLILVPHLAVFSRRMHDINKSGMLFLLGIVPFGIVFLIVFLATDGIKGENRYGKDPKEVFDELHEIGKE